MTPDSNHGRPAREDGRALVRRRQFLRGLGALGLLAAVPAGVQSRQPGFELAPPEDGVLYRSRRARRAPQVALARATNDAESIGAGVRRAVDLLGGMASIVQPGERVLIKPNLVRDYPGETGITTDVRLVREVVRLVLAAGGRPFIGEACGSLSSRWYPGYTGELFQHLGFADLAVELGLDLVDFDLDDVILTSVEGGRGYSRPFPLPESALRADKIILLPKIKGHSEVVYTGALKLNMGFAPGMYRRVNHLGGIYEPVLDVATALYPDLVIADGVIAGAGRTAGNEPANVTPVPLGVVVAGQDPVAVDAVVEAMVGLPARAVPLTRLAGERGLGASDLAQIAVVGETIASAQRRLDMPSEAPTGLFNFGVEELVKPQLLWARAHGSLLASGVKVVRP